MKYPLNVGDSFTMRDANGIHLNFIIAESSPADGGNVMVVYLSSSESVFKDPTTILKLGDHPFVDAGHNESWIKYQNPMIFTRQELHVRITEYFGPVSQELLERIQDGICRSRYCPKNLKQIFREWHQGKLLRSQ